MDRLQNLKPFSKENPGKPHTQKGPYLTPILKKILNKKMMVKDPEVKKLLATKFNKLPIKKLIMLRYALNAIQGENQAIEGILDRIDGKLNSNGNGKGGVIIQIINGYRDTSSDSPIRSEAGANKPT